MTHRTTGRSRLETLDAGARLLLGCGGCLSAGFLVIIAGGLVLFAFLLLIGFSGGSRSVAEQARPEALAIMGGVVALAVVLLVAWWRGLKGNTVALVVLVLAGIALALVTTNLYWSFKSDLDRPGDLEFLFFFLAAASAPVAMATGAGVRLVVAYVRRGRPAG